MQPTPEQPVSFADFKAHLVRLSETEVGYVLIGGLAVSAWAEAHLTLAESVEFDLPIYSKDIDLRGGKAAAMILAESLQAAGAEMKGIVAATRKAAPHMGRIFAVGLLWRGQRTSVEVLERLPGLDSSLDEPPCGTPVATAEGIALLDPCSICICKLHAANTRPGEGANNDVKHLLILARVIPRFLEKVRVTALPEYDAREDAQRLLALLERCIAGHEPLRIPLPEADLAGLLAALRLHLN
ncbi:MAG: hypothetical protein ACKVY0_22860 [Prosthecobacter sp.]|uniref:hypothetical protein n=1 Tax=Prosthecobacter sp. TaxID=1965333 RepID=UPI0039025762